MIFSVFTDVQEFKSSFKQCVSQGVKNIFQVKKTLDIKLITNYLLLC